VGIYVRISDDHEGKALGVARQLAECRRLIAAYPGWVEVDMYTDNDVSVFSCKPRKQYLRMLGDVAAGRLDVIVAWHTDRLHRPKMTELEKFIEVIETAGVMVRTVTSGDLGHPRATDVTTA
jgi:DNA invertase Pin-like site-specific DNA recombinase